MDDETKQKVTDTVMSILKEADMNEMTEYKVRKQASDILSIDLSQSEPKLFVRRIVKTFLDSRAELTEDEVAKPVPESEEIVEEEEELKEEAEADGDEEDGDKKMKGGSKEYDDDGDLILSDKRRVTVQDFKGKTLVSIREYYTKDGKELPSSKGISLTAEQWSVFKQNATAIEQAIQKLESR